MVNSNNLLNLLMHCDLQNIDWDRFGPQKFKIYYRSTVLMWFEMKITSMLTILTYFEQKLNCEVFSNNSFLYK